VVESSARIRRMWDKTQLDGAALWALEGHPDTKTKVMRRMEAIWLESAVGRNTLRDGEIGQLKGC
jgi:hypothetical protein